MRCAPLLAGVLLLHGCTARPAVTPQRIVSDNPCVDAILADVATPTQIGAVSTYSHDPHATSAPIGWAQHFPAMGGTAEEIIAAHPSLYLTGSPMMPATRAVADRAGIKVIALPVANSVSESEMQIVTVARAIGREAAGARLIGQIESAARPHRATHISALIYQGGGLILGQGTLADDLLRRSGFRNAARLYGAKAWDVQPLERIIIAPPQLILAPRTAHGEEARGLNQLRTALAHVGHTVRVADFDPQLLYCGAGSIIKASARLAEIRQQ